jgi:hypothetical protein
MPLLEINQRRYISASVRLDESAAKPVYQYPLSSTNPRTMCWTRLSTMSARRTLISRTFSKTPQAKQVGRANYCCTVLLLGVTRRWTCTPSPNWSAFSCF